MPPLFRFPVQSKFKAKTKAKATSGRRWRQLLPPSLLAIAASLALLASTGKRPAAGGALLTSATARFQGRGWGTLFSRRAPTSPTLIVPPPVLPQPLPPQQAWPDLPLVQPPPSFIDLDSGHWAWPLLVDLTRRDLVAGFPDDTFRPTAPMTRAEFAAQVAQLFNFSENLSLPPDDIVYPDLPPTHWAYSGVQQAVQMGFLSGDPDGLFLPDETMSRIHVIVALANGLGLKSSSGTAKVLAAYTDQSEVPPWATNRLVAALEADLVVNYPDRQTLAPNRPANRAEVATMLHQALVYTGKLQPVAFPYVAKPATAE